MESMQKWPVACFFLHLQSWSCEKLTSRIKLYVDHFGMVAGTVGLLSVIPNQLRCKIRDANRLIRGN